MFTRSSLLALAAAPLFALAGGADAQTTPFVPKTGPVKPLPAPVPSRDVYTSVAVYDNDDLTPLAGIDVQLTPEDGTPVLGTTGQYGNTEFFVMPNGGHVDVVLEETPIDGGLALGTVSGFDIAMDGDALLSYQRSFAQPKAHSLVIDDNGTGEQRFFPEDRSFPLWDINVLPKSGVKFTADIGMLVNETVVGETLAYYGYPGPADQYRRGLFMRVGSPGGAVLGDDGIALVMHNYGELDYRNMQLDVLHVAPLGQPGSSDDGARAERDAATAATSTFSVVAKSLDSAEMAMYYLGGDMPEGYLFFVWRDDKVSDYSDILEVPLNTPEFHGDKTAGFDVVDLTGDEPSYATACTDCDPGLPNYDPSWTCDPGEPSGWTKFWYYNCPGDGDKVGGVSCSQWGIPTTPIFCDTNGNLELCVEASASISLTAKLKGGEIGGSVGVTTSMSTTANIVPGDNGCGECVRLWGVGLICAQEFSNKADVVCNSGGYCYGTTWTKDCYEYDPIFTKCVDVKITVARCPRG